MSTIPFTTEGVDLASYDNLISCKSNVGEIKLTASSTQIDYNEFDEIGIIILNFFRYFHIFCSSDMDNDEELITTQYLNRTCEPGNGIIGGLRLPSSSSYIGEPLTASQRSISTSNCNSNTSSSEQQQKQSFSSKKSRLAVSAKSHWPKTKFQG